MPGTFSLPELSFGADLVQRGNPILESVRNVGKEFGDILADYQVGRTTGVLFLRYVDSCLTAMSRYERMAVYAVYDIIDYILNIFISVLRSLATRTISASFY